MQMLSAFTALDFETTGAVPGYAVEPWQIGVAVWRDGAWQLWESLLKIGPRPFHPRAPGRHAALRKTLEISPALPELLPEIRGRLLGQPLVAHNVATERNCLKAAVPMEKFGPWIDTLKLSRAVWPALPSYALGDLMDRFDLRAEALRGCPDREEHDALFDALGAGLLLQHILRQPGWDRAGMEVLLHPDQRAWQARRRSAG